MLQLVSLCLAIFVIVRGSDIPQLKSDIANMSDRDLIIQLIDRVNHLETVNGIQHKRIEEMENTINRQTRLIEKFGKILEEQVKQVDTNPKEEANEPTNIYESQREETGKHRIRQVSDTHVAFSALANHPMNHLGAQQNLVYEVENVDITNVYDSHNGVFTAPVSGVYFITASVLAGNNREVWCDIVVNGVLKSHVYARGTDNRHDMGSQSILLHLRKGDDVAVRNEALDDFVYGDLYTSFSGFLLFEEELPKVVG